MNMTERSRIEDQILELAELKVGDGKYAFGFGYLFAALSDEQLARLDEFSAASIKEALETK